MSTREAFICDAARTPIGRYGGALAKVRTDDLAAIPIKALMVRHPKVDWEKLDEVYYGCANQAGEDNRNVARMALLLAGLPDCVPGVTREQIQGSTGWKVAFADKVVETPVSTARELEVLRDLQARTKRAHSEAA